MWRERGLMFSLLRMAIMPMISLRNSIENWWVIAHGLKEPRRKRRLQIDRRMEFSSNYG